MRVRSSNHGISLGSRISTGFMRVGALVFLVLIFLMLLGNPAVLYANPFGVGHGDREPSCASCHTWSHSPTFDLDSSTSYPDAFIQLQTSSKTVKSGGKITILAHANGGNYSLRGFFLTIHLTGTSQTMQGTFHKTAFVTRSSFLRDFSNPKDLGWQISQTSYGLPVNYLEQSIQIAKTPIRYEMIAPTVSKKSSYSFVSMLAYSTHTDIRNLEDFSAAQLMISDPLTITVEPTDAQPATSHTSNSQSSASPHFKSNHLKSNNLEQMLREKALLIQDWIIGFITWFILGFCLVLFLLYPYYIRVLKEFPHKIGSDVWWLLYTLLRDGSLFIGIILGIIYIFPSNAGSFRVESMLFMPFSTVGIMAWISILMLILALVIRFIKNLDSQEWIRYTILILVALGYLLFTLSYFITASEITVLFPTT